jgi:excisionase family DNA binding protein
LSLQEASDLAGGISTRTLRREIDAGRLRIVRVRARVLIDPGDLDAWIAACKEPLNDDDDRAVTRSLVRVAAAGVGHDASP